MTYVQNNLVGGNLINVSTYMITFNQQNLAYDTQAEFDTQYNAGNYSNITTIIRNKVFDLNTTVQLLHESDNHTSLPTISNNEITFPVGKYLLQGCPTLFDGQNRSSFYGSVVSYGFKTSSSFIGFKGIISNSDEYTYDNSIQWPEGNIRRYYSGQKYAKAYISVSNINNTYTFETDTLYTANAYRNPFLYTNNYTLQSTHQAYNNSSLNQNFGSPGKILIFKI